MIRKAILVSVTLIVWGFMALGGPTGGQETSEADAEEQIVAGMVKDQAGNPVAGAQVAALPMSNRYVLTDAEGRFEISWKRKWEPRRVLCLMARHVKLELAALVDITRQTRMINIELEPALALTGTVEDTNVISIPGAKVGLSLIKGTWGCGTPVKSVITDDTGRYEFQALPQKQKYGIGTNAEGYGRIHITTGVINKKKAIAEVEPIVLKPTNMSVSGIVMDVNGHSVEAATVTLGSEGQPHRETKTDAQGKFKLKNICSGSISISAVTESGLRGNLKTQSGENVKIIVFQMREEVPFEEASIAIDPKKEGLQYRWSRDAWRLVEGKGDQILELSTEKPAGVKLPKFKNHNVLFGQWHSPVVKEGYRWIALDRTHKYGQYDRLIIDSNGNGYLNDETAMMAYRTLQQYRAHFGPVNVFLEGEAGPVRYHLNFGFYNDGNRKTLHASSAGWYEGYITTLRGAKQRCLLVDKNADGTFDTKSPKLNECDLIGFGEENGRITRFIGNYIELDGRLYRPEITRDGDHMNVNLMLAENVQFGKIRLPENIMEFAAAGENGLFDVRPIKGVAKLPVGKYCIDHWVIEHKDEKSNKWTLRGHSFGDSGIFDVSEGRQTTLSVGEPIFTSLEQVSQKGASYNFINPKLKGRLVENIDLTCNEEPLRSQLHIRSTDGSYDRTFTFEYG